MDSTAEVVNMFTSSIPSTACGSPSSAPSIRGVYRSIHQSCMLGLIPREGLSALNRVLRNICGGSNYQNRRSGKRQGRRVGSEEKAWCCRCVLADG